MTAITIHILVKNHESSILDCLQSLASLDATLLIGNIGSEDDTIKICRQFTNNIKRLYLNDDLSKIRNEMIELSTTKWNFYIEPWEVFLSGAEEINSIVYNPIECFSVNVLQSDVLTKQARIWHKETGVSFKNPVFETLNTSGKSLPIYIKSNVRSDTIEKELLENWNKKSPFNLETIYYTACSFFKDKNWNSFLNYSESYLHQEKVQKHSYFMMLYYRAMVFCYMKKDFENAIKSIIPCIAKKPTSSEFWCLLADIYYATRDYNKAKIFYENAIILGSRRLIEDDYPMEISKYKEYPEKMIAACDAIKQSSKIYSGKVHLG